MNSEYVDGANQPLCKTTHMNQNTIGVVGASDNIKRRE
jgi:hypothetical protein